MRSVVVLASVVLMSVFATGCLGNVRGIPRVGPTEHASGEPTHTTYVAAISAPGAAH